jgi:hypothetical protein
MSSHSRCCLRAASLHIEKKKMLVLTLRIVEYTLGDLRMFLQLVYLFRAQLCVDFRLGLVVDSVDSQRYGCVSLSD